MPRIPFGTITCTIFVGSAKEESVIHKDVLCEISSYFKAAFNGKFKEGEEGNISLLEEDPEIFELFQLWVYKGTFLLAGQEIQDLASTSLVDLYIFAEARDIPTLQNSVVNALIELEVTDGQIPTDVLSRVYANTRITSPLRKLIVGMAASLGDLDGDELWATSHIEDHWPKEYSSLLSTSYTS